MPDPKTIIKPDQFSMEILGRVSAKSTPIGRPALPFSSACDLSIKERGSIGNGTSPPFR